jgi:hypothetical protein
MTDEKPVPAVRSGRHDHGCRRRCRCQGEFAHDLATRLPTFSFITPNKCNDDHDCAVSVGDAYLQSLIGAIASSRQYREGHTVIFITWLDLA